MVATELFLAVAVVVSVAAFLALFGVIRLAMSERDTVSRDGLLPGTSAPRWTLSTTTGRILDSPATEKYQFILFSGQSLWRFPSVVEGIQTVQAEAGDDLEIVLLLRRPDEAIGPVLDELGLGTLTVVMGTPELYGKYNVRVTPFGIFIDRAGRVRCGSLVNFGWQIETLWRMATTTEEVDRGLGGLQRLVR